MNDRSHSRSPRDRRGLSTPQRDVSAQVSRPRGIRFMFRKKGKWFYFNEGVQLQLLDAYVRLDQMNPSVEVAIGHNRQVLLHWIHAGKQMFQLGPWDPVRRRRHTRKVEGTF